MESPEYKAISSCRDELASLLSTCLEEVACPLRQSEALTDRRYKTIVGLEDGAGAVMLIEDFLVFTKTSPLNCYVEFMTTIIKHGNRLVRGFVKNTIEAKRKKFYRELLIVPPSFVASQEYDVFISYSHEDDTMRTVDTLMSRLKHEGLTVFVGERSIRPGDKWPFEISSAIKTCKAFVVMLTKEYMKSVYCNGELFEAEALGKRLFPVVCEHGWGDVPGATPVIEVLKVFQDVSLVTGNKEKQLTKLVHSIKGAVAPLSPLSPVAVAPDSPNLPTDQADGATPERKQSLIADAKFAAWKEKLGPKLSLEIRQYDLILVAGLFDKVEPYLDQFGLTDGEKSDVRASALLNGTQVGMGAAFSTWKSHQPWHATYGALLDIVLRLNKVKVALGLCEFLDQLQLVNKAATQLSERTPLTQDEIDALQKLIEGTGVNIDDIIATGQGLTLEEAQPLLAEKGYIEDAGNLKTRLQEIAKEQQRYLEILKDLMTATDTIDLRYLKLYLVGPPYVGKTTTLSRLLKTLKNIHSAGGKLNIQNTLLANCIQAFAFVDDDTAEWLSSNNVDNEAQLLFKYLCGPLDTPLSEQLSEEHTTPPEPSREQSHVQQDESHKLISVENVVSQVDKLDTLDGETKTCKNQRINDCISQFQKLIKSGDYSTLFKALGTFLNINDIGGQPGFLEMLPALSTGPAMYLVFLDLSKELNKPYEIHFSRNGEKITPYDAMHTVKDTVSQILSSISSIHSIPQVTCSFKTDKVDGFSEKLELFQQVSPLAALIGTHKDKLEHPEKEIKKKSKDLNDMVKKQFDKIMITPGATDSNLFTVDNRYGTEQSDIGPLRKVLSDNFQTRFKNASLPIRPKWLLFGLILRREYKIANIEDCLELGKKLEMDENETTFCLRYLHDCVGTIKRFE